MPPSEYNKTFSDLYDIILRLRGPDGCPWDQKQNPESIKKYLIEETHELADAMTKDDHQHICEEIGDLFFILLLITRIYEEEKHFSMNDIFSAITQKMIRRHPHVFEGLETGNESELKKQWEAIKKMEKKEP